MQQHVCMAADGIGRMQSCPTPLSLQCAADTALLIEPLNIAPSSQSFSPVASSPSELVIMVGYGQMHKQALRKEWAAFYVDYDLLQRMLQNFIDFPGHVRALGASRVVAVEMLRSHVARLLHHARVPASVPRRVEQGAIIRAQTR